MKVIITTSKLSDMKEVEAVFKNDGWEIVKPVKKIWLWKSFKFSYILEMELITN